MIAFRETFGGCLILVYLKEPERSALRFDSLAEGGAVVRTVGTIEEARAAAADAEILVTLGPHLGADAAALFASASRLRWVQLISTGSDNVAEHLRGTSVQLTTTRGLHGRQMSEAALAAMLALSRQLPRVLRNQAAARWERFPAALLDGCTVGLLGLGAIADALAPRCRALGMRVVGITGTPRALPQFDEVRSRDALHRAIADLDHLVLLAPYSARTHRLIDGAALRAMKPGAYLINLARGGIVDEQALLAALDAGDIAGAASDVFETEPLPAGSPLWSHPRMIVTPHVGGFHEGYAADVVALTRENLRRFHAGGAEPLINQVDLQGAPVHAI